MIETLKDACVQVQKRVIGLLGTPEGNTKMGIGAGGDISKKIDIIAENTVIEVINNSKKNPTIIGEECGILDGNDGFLIMDALDGTTNASRGIPYCCCSLAYSTFPNLSSVTDAAVIDIVTGDLYYAVKGGGAFLNNEKIFVRKNEKIIFEDLVGGINISGLSADSLISTAPYLTKMRHVRSYGANALELCFLSRGFLDFYIDLRQKIRPTDMAASYLIVNESGGKISDKEGKTLDSDVYFSSRLSFISVTDLRILEYFLRN